MSGTGCPHVAKLFANEYVKNSVLKKYKTVSAWMVNRSRTGANPAKRRKISAPSCATCDLALPRPFACLQCTYIGCWNDDHVVSHLGDAEHLLCVDVKTGAIFCSECDDFIYQKALEDEYLSAILDAEEKATRFHVTKRPREPYKSWSPNDRERAALEGMEALSCQGRRGLLNLGQTCFLNVVLQSFVHNPLLRNWFLSDKHNSKLCKTKDCTCCEMDQLFAEVFSGTVNGPYGPTSFLATTWRASAELSGYAQQDAHECFISVLNQIHATSRGSTNVSCNCVVHNTFAGQLQSDVRCERCGNVTVTVDPMFDISLELTGKGKGADARSDLTLAGCLRKYTQPEKLGSKEYTCAKCAKGSHEASKRMSIRKLPPVLSFLFKRFEHKTSDKSSAQKVDGHLRFPASLNMSPYTTLAMTIRDKENEKESKSKAAAAVPDLGPEVLYEYDLFAVICHEGQMDNGHYTNFARFQDEWYRFDDEKVTHSTLGACLSAPAYMLFYVKRHLDYKPWLVPSYILTREVEAKKEEEREKEKEAARRRGLDDEILGLL